MKSWARMAIAGICLSLGTGAGAAPFAYSVQSDLDSNLYAIDLATGAATLVGDTACRISRG